MVGRWISFWGQASFQGLLVSFRGCSVRMFDVAYVFFCSFLTHTLHIWFSRICLVASSTQSLKLWAPGHRWRCARWNARDDSRGHPETQCFKNCTNHLSNEKKGPWLFAVYRGWNTTQVYREYNKPWNMDPYEPTSIQRKVGPGFLTVAHLLVGWLDN